jgi:O-antigen/teichoic acid export membrane protein
MINAIGALIAICFLVYIAHKYHIEGVGATYLFLSVATMMFIVFLSLYILLMKHFIMNWRLSLFGTFLICKNIYLAYAVKIRNSKKNG